jgi:hypothetical protein
MKSQPGTQDVTREHLVTNGGLETFVIEGELFAPFRFRRLVYLHDGLGFNATYLVRADQFDIWAETIAESFRTFEVIED